MSKQKLKLRLKNIYGEKGNLFFVLAKKTIDKSLHNENVGATKLVKVLSALYEEKLVD